MSAKQTNFDTIAVIVGRDLIGDALIKLPFVRALRSAFPASKITWLTSEGPTAYAGQLREVTQTLINEVSETPEWLLHLGVEGAPKPPAFDLVIDTRNRWEPALKARKIPHRLFLAPALRHLLSDRKPSLLNLKPPHLVDRLLQLVALAAGHVPPSNSRLTVSAETVAKARQILPQSGAATNYLGLVPGAGNITKAWPRYKFERIAEEQSKRGMVPVFLLGPQEADWHAELVAAVPQAIFPLQRGDIWGTDNITIEQTLAVASLLTLAVTNDCGTSHMLAAMDCPLISLFGPTSPDKFAPRVSHGRVIRSQTFGSDFISAITWEAVSEAVTNMLKTLNETNKAA